MKLLESVADVLNASRAADRPLGLVPTMGALHAGHISLVRRAIADNRSVVVSIFVNPAQFDSEEDVENYPMEISRDVSMLEAEGVDIIFAPSPREMYSEGFDTRVIVGRIADRLEGKYRPNHFTGVTTIVAKLLNIVEPEKAYFGQKDAQQLSVVRRMVVDLNIKTDIVALPIVRAADGLAWSSRNVHLTSNQRRSAPVLYQSLIQAKKMWKNGTIDPAKLEMGIRRTLERTPEVDSIDYVSIVDPDTMEDALDLRHSALILVAIRMGMTRLIDNASLCIADD